MHLQCYIQIWVGAVQFCTFFGDLRWNDPDTKIIFYFQTPFEHAQAAKNKGNKYFKGTKYEEAIKCYTQAIELCPEKHKQELSTFYQNRAAAQDQLVSRVL